MSEFMAAADCLIGKPGGLTISEALARGLPMVIVNPIPGQEERNADYLLEEGAAIRGNNLPALA
jgi:processive 1,2-diacylglycerol beta-glucosyltransferase